MIGTGLGAVMLAAVVGLGGWWLARRSAARRGLALGTFPATLVIPLAVIVGLDGVWHGVVPRVLVAIALVGIAGIVDARTGFIFDALSGALIGSSALIALLDHRVADAVAGALALGGAFAALYIATGRRGIGLGDVKLAAGIGAALGPWSGGTAIGSAFVLGGTYGALLIAGGRATRHAEIRFGPFLAAGICVAALFPGAPR